MMNKYKIIISRYFEEIIEAETEDEAFDKAYDAFQNEEVEAYFYKVEEDSELN